MATKQRRESEEPAFAPEPAEDPRSFIALIRELPGLLLELVRGEFEFFKREMVRKTSMFGWAALMFAIAGGFAFFFFGILTTAGLLALALVVPAWAAALIISGVLIALVLIFIGIGVGLFKKAASLIPTETIDNIVADAHALKGEGRFDE